MANTRIQELLRPFAKSIEAKARAIRDLDLTREQRKRIEEAISDDIKKCTNFITPSVSIEAANEAAKLDVDLVSVSWHGQLRFDPGRQLFHLEHINPVSAIREKCVQQCDEEQILNTLLADLRAAWILKSEDQRLTQLGFRSKRADPTEAYRLAGIEILTS